MGPVQSQEALKLEKLSKLEPKGNLTKIQCCGNRIWRVADLLLLSLKEKEEVSGVQSFEQPFAMDKARNWTMIIQLAEELYEGFSFTD